MTHEELVTRVAIAMRTKREAILERPLSRCWEDLARVAVEIAEEESMERHHKFIDAYNAHDDHASIDGQIGFLLSLMKEGELA